MSYERPIDPHTDPEMPVTMPEEDTEEWAVGGGAERLPSSGTHEEEPELFRNWENPGYMLSQRAPLHGERTPNFGHFSILLLIVMMAWAGVGVFLIAATRLHWFGLQSTKQVADNMQVMLAMQAVLYLLTLLGSQLIFPLVWQKGLFTGLHWNGRIAFRFRRRLLAATFLCFFLAVVNSVLLPGPTDAPIDKIFRSPGIAWLMFGFGTTFAPFFEEMAFRGFLLPMLCTAVDWMREMSAGRLPLRNCHNGHPRWTLPSMMAGAMLTSVPFALIHAEQTAWAIGPFLLLFSVSLVLCWVRLSTRSLAASVLVHAAYNFMLFALMLAGTGGFQHMDKM